MAKQRAAGEEEGQDSTAVALLRSGLAQFVSEKIFDPRLEAAVAENPTDALGILRDFLAHRDREVRFVAARLTAIAGVSSNVASDRRAATEALARLLRDDEVLVWQHAAKDLLQFRAADFSPDAQRVLLDLLAEKPTREVVRVVGVAELRAEEDNLAELIDEQREELLRGQPARYGSVDWAVRLARARMGSSEDVLIVVSEVEGERNEVLRVTQLLDDLAYTRSREAVEALIDYLESNTRLPQYANRIPGSPHSQYALSVLAGMFEDFPVPAREPGEYSGAEIRTSRKWMADSAHWESQL